MSIENNNVYEGRDDSINYVLTTMNDCVIFIQYSSSHNTYNLEYMLTENFTKYYPNKMDTYFNEQFQRDVNYKKLRGWLYEGDE